MAYFFQDNDSDSAFGDDDLFCTLPMFTTLPAPLAGSKRSAEVLWNNDPSTVAGLTAGTEHSAEHIDPKVLTCHGCDEALCSGPAPAPRPWKRTASAPKVAEYHNRPGGVGDAQTQADHQCSDTCLDTCQACDWEPPCSSSCTLPCPVETQCSQGNACWDPCCDPRPCADECVDPECKKIIGVDDPCFCQKCDAQPCPLGDPNNECHFAHSGPTASGTIYCYDNAPCHFQDGHHGLNSDLSGYEVYPCYSQSHDVSSHCNGTVDASTSATPILSPGNYASLESSFSSQPSPAPAHENSTHCFLDIPAEHCHIDNSCCHGSTRACGDCSTASQENIDVWNASVAQGNGLADNFMNFGLGSSQSVTDFSSSQPASGSNSLSYSLYDSMLRFQDATWIPSTSQYPGSFPPLEPGTGTLDFLPSSTQDGTAKAEPSLPEATASMVGNRDLEAATAAETANEEPQGCVCKWQNSPGVLCLAAFDDPKALHAHVKTAHVDHCVHCSCQWEGCESSSKDFKQRSKLSRHLLRHAGYRPYTCSFAGCNRTFATNQTKENHERTHTGDRPYACNRCDFTTATYTQLQTHISALHEGKKPHKCRFCDFSCADSSNLSKHERTHQVSLSVTRMPMTY